jgi:hypothetical protein
MAAVAQHNEAPNAEGGSSDDPESDDEDAYFESENESEVDSYPDDSDGDDGGGAATTKCERCKAKRPEGDPCRRCSPVVLDTSKPFRTRLFHGGTWILRTADAAQPGYLKLESMHRKRGMQIALHWVGAVCTPEELEEGYGYGRGDGRHDPESWHIGVAVAPALKWVLRKSPVSQAYALSPAVVPLRGMVEEFSRKERKWFKGLFGCMNRLWLEKRGLPLEVWLVVMQCAQPEAKPGTAAAIIDLAGRTVEVRRSRAPKTGTLTLSITPEGLLKGEHIRQVWRMF